MSKIMKLACVALMIAIAIPGPNSMLARAASGIKHVTCARYGVALNVPASWTQEAQTCDSTGLSALYISGDQTAMIEVIGVAAMSSSTDLRFAARTFVKDLKLNSKIAHFSPKIINGVRFLDTTITGSNEIFNQSAWNLLATTVRSGFVLGFLGAVEQSGNGSFSSEKKEISNALGSIRFTKPGKAAQPAPAPKAPADVCDPDSHVCASASNLHQDSGGDIPPPSGQQYVVVHVKLVNNGSQSADYNELDFVLKGADTHVDYQPGALDINITNTSLNSGSLLAGDIVEGDIAFQAPTGENSFSLIWQPNFMGNAMAVPIN